MTTNFCQIAASGDAAVFLNGLCNFSTSEEGRNLLTFIGSFLGILVAIKRLVVNLFVRRFTMLGVVLLIAATGFLFRDQISPRSDWFTPSARGTNTKPDKKPIPAPRQRPPAPRDFWDETYQNDIIKGRR